MVKESISNPPDTPQGGHAGEDALGSLNLSGVTASLVAQVSPGSAVVRELEAHAEGLLLSIAPEGLQDVVHAVLSPSDSSGNTVVEELEGRAEGLLQSIAPQGLQDVVHAVLPPPDSSGNTVVGELEGRAEGLLLSIAPQGLQDAVHAVFPPSDSSGNTVVGELEGRAEGLLLSIAPQGLQGVVHAVLSPSDSSGDAMVGELEGRAEGLLQSIAPQGLQDVVHAVLPPPDSSGSAVVGDPEGRAEGSIAPQGIQDVVHAVLPPSDSSGGPVVRELETCVEGLLLSIAPEGLQDVVHAVLPPSDSSGNAVVGELEGRAEELLQAAPQGLQDVVHAVLPPSDSSGSTVVGELEGRAEGLLLSIASQGLQDAVHAVLPPPDSSGSAVVGELGGRAEGSLLSIAPRGLQDVVHAVLPPSGSPGSASVGELKTRAEGLLQSIAPQGLQDAVHAVLPPSDSSNSAVVGELETRAEGLLLSIAPQGLQGVVHAVLPPLDSNVPTTNDLMTSQKSLLGPGFISVETIESSAGVLTSNVANTATVDSVEEIKDKAQTFILARLRATVFVYATRLPIIGSYFIDKKPVGEPNVDALATETTPLLGVLRDPRAFATKEAEGLLYRLLSPLLKRLPDVDTLDNMGSDDHGLFLKIFVESYVLARDGGGWLFTHLQEHSLVVAPTVSLGHLSTTGLAASTIGTAVASVTGYSVIQGFTSSLDKVLASAPNRRTARIACAQAAVVTGVVLFPITNLWSFQSATILRRAGQSPEVAAPASEFLRVTAAGLPGYAVAEIAKRYLMSQGLSSVHTSMLSATAPVNMVLNYLLVDGPIPALRLGFTGAPLCTILSHNALAIMLIIYIVQRTIREEVEYLRGLNTVPDEPVSANRNSSGSIGSNHTPEPPQDHRVATFFTGLGKLVFAGASGILKSASQLWSKDFGGVVASILGPNSLATQAVLLTTATTLYQAPKAMGNASSQRIRKWITRGDVQRAKISAAVAFVGTLGEVILISNVLLASASSWGRLFNSDPVILQSVSALLPVIAVFQAVHGVGAWVDSSLEALGKPAVFPSLNASADYFLGIPLGVYLALSRQWGLAGLWIGLTVSLAYSCLMGTIVLVRTNWRNAVNVRGASAPRVEGETHATADPRDFGALT